MKLPIPVITRLRPVKTNVPLMLTTGFGLLLIIGLMSGVLSFRLSNEEGWVRHTLTVQGQLSDVLSTLQDAETGQRGFLLTSDDSYLAPFRAAVAAFPRDLEELRIATSDNDSQQKRIQALTAAANAKFSELQRIIDQFRSEPQAALIELKKGPGKALMDNARAIISAMKAEEIGLLQKRQSNAAFTNKLLQASTSTAAILASILFLFALRQIGSMMTSLQSTNDRLTLEIETSRRLSEQLRQSQKMEAIGQLTGGVAHDFNNILAIVLGSLDLLQRRLVKGRTDVEELVKAGIDGAQRGAALTRRLLAFSRLQPLEPQPLDANKFVSDISAILRRALGEQIVFETVLAGGLWLTHADASQLENAVLNLALNARDAMPDGGKLTIETSNSHLDERYAADYVDVPPGQYVLVAVTDTGTGMTPEVKAKAFEPFFTTKAAGRGSGLGLSQVYGFVKQSKGHIKVYSEPGHGTTIKLYLPRFTGTLAAHSEGNVTPLPANHVTGETVLVVEDEAAVRRITVQTLQDLGYRVLQADGSDAALAILDSEPLIDLLFTDIVMPGANGRQLADEVLRRRPEIKVIFTTGFTRNAIIHNGVLDTGVNFIAKPFSTDDLARLLRKVLDVGN